MIGKNEAALRKTRTAALFTRASGSYDSIIPLFTHFGRRIVELSGVAEGERILDVATGRGACLFPAADRVGAAGRVVGVDLAEGMVSATRAEALRRGLENVEVGSMDAEELEFAAGEFDRVICAFGVMFFPDPERALTEACRVTRPGGRLAVSTWVGAGERWKFVTELAESIIGPQSRPIEGRWDSADGLEAMLAGAGCVEISIVEETHNFAFETPEVWWQWMWTQGHRFFLERMSDADRARFKALAFERLEIMRCNHELHLEQRMRLALGRRAP